MARVLVTGGAGYIGSHVVLALLERGHAVRVLDNLSGGHAAVVPPGLLVRGDVGDAALLDRLLGGERWDAVMHFAGLIQVGESVARPLAYYRNNVAAPVALLQAMVDHGVGTMIFSSSAGIYGEPRQVPITEDHPADPLSPYGQSKRMVEQVLAAARRAHGLAYAALRYFNAAGADPAGRTGEDHDPETHLIPVALRAALGGEPLTVFGDDYPTADGTCIRDYIHVTDLAEAHCVALEALLRRPELSGPYNLGIGRGYSVREVLRTVEQVVGRPVPHTVGPRRAGDPAVLVADPARFAATFGWQPRYPDLADMVATAAAWHRSGSGTGLG